MVFGSISMIFQARHPFMLLIWDNQTQTILFIPKMINPKFLEEPAEKHFSTCIMIRRHQQQFLITH